MDQIPNNPSSINTNTSDSPRHRQHQLQHHLQQQRATIQQQQQQLYNLIPPQSALSQSYSPHINLPPIPVNSQYYPEDLHSPTQTSPPTSASATGAVPSNWAAHHRTSSSRDDLTSRYEQEELYRLQQQHEQQLQREQQQHLQQRQFKREREEGMAYNKDDKGNVAGGSTSTTSHPPARGAEDPMPSTSDFVKKLYKCVFSCSRNQSLDRAFNQDARRSIFPISSMLGSSRGLFRGQGI